MTAQNSVRNFHYILNEYGQKFTFMELLLAGEVEEI